MSATAFDDQTRGGYLDQSMSVRAAAAYDDDARPLSKINAQWLREHGIGCTPAELRDLVCTFTVITTEWHHTVEWLEWHGKGVRPDEHRADGATVRIQIRRKHRHAEVVLPGGQRFEKYEDATGFNYESAITRRERERREQERRRAAKWREREIAGQWRDLIKRFKVAVAGRKLESCDYFGWRDGAERDSAAVQWTPISHADVIAALRASGLDFGLRTVERLESGERGVVRLGLHAGIRYRPTTV